MPQYGIMVVLKFHTSCLYILHLLYLCNFDSDQENPLQQLNQELSQKQVLLSKNAVHLSKVVGQGIYSLIFVYTVILEISDLEKFSYNENVRKLKI